MFSGFGQRRAGRRARVIACGVLLALGPSIAGEGPRPPRFTTDAESRRAAPELRAALSEHPFRVEWRATSERSALPFAREAFARLASAWKVPLTKSAPRTLRFELSALGVEERPESVGATYVASVSLALTLAGADERVLWKGKARGSSSRFGRAGRSELANLTLSDAFTEALAALLGQDALQEAWLASPAEPAPRPPSRERARSDEPEEPSPPAPAEEELERVSPDALLSDLVALIEAGFEDANLLDVVASKALTRAFDEKDLASWRAAGIPESVLHAARTRPER